MNIYIIFTIDNNLILYIIKCYILNYKERVMIEELKINNFRSIKSLKIDNFKNINIFLGKANTGKTSILEAIYIILSMDSRAIIRITNLRSIGLYNDIFDSLFYDYNTNVSIKFDIKVDNELVELEIKPNIVNSTISFSEKNITDNNIETINNIYNLNFNYLKNGKNYTPNISIEKNNNEMKFLFNISVSAFFYRVELIADYSSSLYKNLKIIFENNAKKEELKKYYQQFDNRIKDIRFIENKIVVEIEGLHNAINIKAVGKGFQTYITIIASIVVGNKYILIDEIENGIHFETMKILLKNIIDLSKEYNLQFFITTHSKEFIQTLNDIIEKDYSRSNIISVFNLYCNKENNIDVIDYSQENFNNLIRNDNEIRD